MGNTVFLTGATGLVGQSLITKILQADGDSILILLIRGDSDYEAALRAHEILSSLSPVVDPELARSRVTAVRGDITLDRLGMDRDFYNDLASKVTHIVHTAASVKFHLSLDEIRAVNVGGTREVFALARRARASGRLERVGYVSTAFVSGDRDGVIREDELDCGQGFSNNYERSKFEAERFVLQMSNLLPVTIFRPSTIVGDSRTGATPVYNSLYAPLKLVCRGLVRMMPGSRETPLDLVPVDYVADAIRHILFRSNEPSGKTFHLAFGGNNTLTAGRVADLTVDFFNRTLPREHISRIEFVSKKTYEAVKHLLEHRERRTFEALQAFDPHLEITKFFDTSNSEAALRSTGIVPQPFERYYTRILDYCILTDWGKRKTHPASVDACRELVCERR
jgi:thioester reductase-like protein